VGKVPPTSRQGHRRKARVNTLAPPPTPQELMRQFLDPTRGVLVIDRDRRIRCINRAFEASLGSPRGQHIGKCLGDALLCGHAKRDPQGCGKSKECLRCAAREITLAALERNETRRSPALFQILAGGRPHEVTLPLCAAPLSLDGKQLAGLVIEDLRPLEQLSRTAPAENFHGMVGRDPQMLYLFDMIRHVGPVDASVLIEGESGTGKQMVARALHQESARRHRALITVNASALPGGLVESELFGHVKGAFTGAIRDKRGRFELADRGTIFLDEVGELSPNLQVKLLRVLQDGTLDRLGDEATTRVDTRVLCATNRSLQREIEAGRFRLDLFYRLCVVLISLPPLRQRAGDIPILARHLLARAAREVDLPPPTILPATLEALAAYPWPGNVRELENAMRYALITSRGEPVRPEDLPAVVARGAPPPQDASTNWTVTDQNGPTVETIEKAIQAAGGNKSEAARRLGISRATLYRRAARRKRERGL